MIMKNYVLISIIFIIILHCIATSSSSVSPLQSNPFISKIGGSQCPINFAKITPREVNADALERAISSKRNNDFTSVLFYASNCPFSYRAHLIFEVLSSMYPQIEHLAVEQSSALPSSCHTLYSRYGIRSLPALLILNGSSRMRYHGSKDLDFLDSFYKKKTGYEPVQYINYGQSEHDLYSITNLSDSLEAKRNFILQSWIGLSESDILKREPYLVLAILCLCLQLVIIVLPKLFQNLRELWVSYGPHLNLQISGETSQILGRIVHVMDVKRIWTKIRLCKSRNLHQGAKNAQLWASSFTSVSLGKTPASRLL